MTHDERQLMFNKIVTNLRRQGKRSAVYGSCKYREPQEPGAELRCGIGHVIEDQYYFTGLEGHGVAERLVLQAIRNSGWNIDPTQNDSDIDDSDAQFLSRLQTAHDAQTITERNGLTTLSQTWEEKWKKIAEQFNLTVPA